MRASKSSLRLATFLAGFALMAVIPATAKEAEGLPLQIENRTSETIDNLRLASGEKYLTEGSQDWIPDLKAGLRTYPEQISPASLGSDVHARFRGKEVVFHPLQHPCRAVAKDRNNHLCTHRGKRDLQSEIRPKAFRG